MLDLQHVKTFVVLVAANSFTEAAERLGCAQSTVTFHIKAIEQELGAVLFERSKFSKHIELTKVGHAVYGYAIQLLAMADEIREKASTADPNAGLGGLRSRKRQ